MGLAGVVLTYNEEQNIVDCLTTLAWADRRVVLDSFSTDRTVELAQEMGAEVLQHPFENYARQRNVALEWVEADWIFFVDADERVPSELAAEVQAVVTGDRPEVGWWVPRHNYIFGRLTRGGRLVSRLSDAPSPARICPLGARGPRNRCGGRPYRLSAKPPYPLQLR